MKKTYLDSFPKSERKPFGLMKLKVRQGGMEFLVILEKGRSVGLAITVLYRDLVLLDYDMPVCDGRHVLEMLRSEKEFEDVSVIFLTSRDDPESVKKVLSLKPEGYMMKYLKPTEIRKRVDDFFRKKKAEQTGRA